MSIVDHKILLSRNIDLPRNNIGQLHFVNIGGIGAKTRLTGAWSFQF